METLTYNVVIETIEEGYLVTVPTLPGCSTWGRTYEEAVAMAQDAIEGFLEALDKAGQPIPTEQKQIGGFKVQVPVRAPLPA